MMSSKKYIYKRKIANIPLSIHWSVLLIFLYASFFSTSFNVYPFIVLSYFLLILAHELGHATICKILGHKVIMIEFEAIGGKCYHEQPQYEYEQILISCGGVLYQLIILLISILMISLFKKHGIPEMNVFYTVTLSIGIVLNSFLIITNLIPLKNLDGYYALRIFKLIPAIIKRRTGKVRNSKKLKLVKPSITRKQANEIVEKTMNQISESGLESLSEQDKSNLESARRTLKHKYYL